MGNRHKVINVAGKTGELELLLLLDNGYKIISWVAVNSYVQYVLEKKGVKHVKKPTR